MITQDYILKLIEEQKTTIESKGETMLRDSLLLTPEINGFATIISGVRRCGKSTLLYQLLKQKHINALHINFDDPRLFEFTLDDFSKLDSILANSNQKTIMLDEIQVINGWEKYVRKKLEEGFNVFVTGSNASLLSKEIGTSLTGRHITQELFPFSYHEYCRFSGFSPSIFSFDEYMNTGGFPEFVKNRQNIILSNLLDDILIRDIAVRYGIKDIMALKRLTIYLLSNIGNLTSANKLKEPCGIKSPTTILEYLSHLEQAYIISLVPMYDISVKKQSINPKKIYTIDIGLVNANVSELKHDTGHKLENLIFLHLRRKYNEIYYNKGKGECDFITVDKGVINQAIQVCYEIDHVNQQREVNGLVEALQRFNLHEGTIITHHQEDMIRIDDYTIHIIPAHKYLT